MEGRGRLREALGDLSRDEGAGSTMALWFLMYGDRMQKRIENKVHTCVCVIWGVTNSDHAATAMPIEPQGKYIQCSWQNRYGVQEKSLGSSVVGPHQFVSGH